MAALIHRLLRDIDLFGILTLRQLLKIQGTDQILLLQRELCQTLTQFLQQDIVRYWSSPICLAI